MPLYITEQQKHITRSAFCVLRSAFCVLRSAFRYIVIHYNQEKLLQSYTKSKLKRNIFIQKFCSFFIMNELNFLYMQICVF
jgi:hypothetical protein